MSAFADDRDARANLNKSSSSAIKRALDDGVDRSVADLPTNGETTPKALVDCMHRRMAAQTLRMNVIVMMYLLRLNFNNGWCICRMMCKRIKSLERDERQNSKYGVILRLRDDSPVRY